MDNKQKSFVGMKVFFKIAEDWDLTLEEAVGLLGMPAEASIMMEMISDWRTIIDNDSEVEHSIPESILYRILMIIKIYKSLHNLIPDTDVANNWVRTRNKFFDDKIVLDYMIGGGSVKRIKHVAEYLDWNISR